MPPLPALRPAGKNLLGRFFWNSFLEAWNTVQVRRGVTAFPTAGEDKVARAAEEATRTRHQWLHFSLHSCISHTDGQRLNATLPTCPRSCPRLHSQTPPDANQARRSTFAQRSVQHQIDKPKRILPKHTIHITHEISHLYIYTTTKFHICMVRQMLACLTHTRTHSQKTHAKAPCAHRHTNTHHWLLYSTEQARFLIPFFSCGEEQKPDFDRCCRRSAPQHHSQATLYSAASPSRRSSGVIHQMVLEKCCSISAFDKLDFFLKIF